MLNIKS